MKTDDILDCYLGKKHLEKLKEFDKPTIHLEILNGLIGHFFFQSKHTIPQDLYKDLLKGFDLIFEFCEQSDLDFVDSNGLLCSFVGETVAMHSIENLVSKIKKVIGPNLSFSLGLHKGDYLIGDFGPQKRLKKILSGDQVNLSYNLARGGLSKKWDIVITDSTFSGNDVDGFNSVSDSAIVGFPNLKILYKNLA